MLKIIQIIAILQGIFVGFTLFQRREEYKKTIFWLFIGCITSVVLFSIGDDDYNLIVEDSSWIFFQETLMITFFFLFIRYSNSDRTTFNKLDTLFFLPYLLNIAFEALLSQEQFKDNLFLEVCAEFTELCIIGMLLYSIYDIFKNKKDKWFLAFIVPFAIIFIIDELSYLILNSKVSILSLDSYGAFLISIFLFYFVTYKLINAPKDILPSIKNKYKSSNLSDSEIKPVITALNRLMTEEKLFKNHKLSVNEIAKRLGITRQDLSQILNVHMGLRFQDFLNQYRVEEFIKCLDQERYKNFTLLGIANEVGFSSKSSFNATFKKMKGMTPSQYRKSKNGL